MPQTISAALRNARERINSSLSETAQLDAEILLAHVLNVSRSYLFASSETALTSLQEKKLDELVVRRMQGEPIPYLTGHQEFWSLDFLVTEDTLIPRPDTELLVELALSLLSQDNKIIADLGTGSGAIALSLAHERPNWIIHAVDYSEKALQVARTNAENLKIKNSFFHQGNWYAALPLLQFDMIVSNPPYLAEDDSHLMTESIRFEPKQALVAGKDGLSAIQEIIKEARSYLKPGGYLLLEHGFDQAAAVRKLFIEAGYTQVSSHKDLSNWDRVTMGKMT